MIPQAAIQNTVVDIPRLEALVSFAQETAELGGAIAEIGVYRGGTAYLLCENANGRTVYLFDTFTGLPRVSDYDLHHEGDFSDTSLQHVLGVLAPFDESTYGLCPGLFPVETGPIIEGEKFSLVHIDCDIYRSVKDSLEFFYPRMVVGGIIVADDYAEPACPGAKKAVDEFLADKPEEIFHRCQCSIAIRKEKND